MALTPADTISLADSSDAVLALTPTDLAALKTQGVDLIDLADDAISLTVTQAQTFVTAHLGFAAGDDVTIADSGAAVAALTSAQLTALKAAGVDGFDLTDDAINLTVAKATTFVRMLQPHPFQSCFHHVKKRRLLQSHFILILVHVPK